MIFNLANLNVRGLKDPSKYARLLGELSDVAAVQETYFTCEEDCVFSNRCSTGGLSAC